MMKRFYSSLITWIISFQLISLILGYITKLGMYPWYGQLVKSSLTPPGYFFGIVWPLLYIGLAISGWKLYKQNKNTLLKWYWIQMFLNWLWSPVFFTLHMIDLALLILILLVAINGYILLQLRITSTNDLYRLLPYFLWLCFATYLNTVIVLLN
jgi:benzodiazapine receptor